MQLVIFGKIFAIGLMLLYLFYQAKLDEENGTVSVLLNDSAVIMSWVLAFSCLFFTKAPISVLYDVFALPIASLLLLIPFGKNGAYMQPGDMKAVYAIYLSNCYVLSFENALYTTSIALIIACTLFAISKKIEGVENGSRQPFFLYIGLGYALSLILFSKIII